MHNPAPSSRERTSASYLYFLVSRTRPDVFKLGVSDDLPARIYSLRGSFGPLDLEASALVGAVDRRRALDLEQTLKILFGAPACRADAPITPPCFPEEDAGAIGNGYTEWYRRDVFDPMLTVVSEVVRRDASHAAVRFAIPQRGIPAAWGSPDTAPPSSHEERRRRRREREEQEGHEALARSEEAFRCLVAWVEARRGRLVAVSQPEEDDRGVLRRAFTFGLAPGTTPEGLHPGTGEWEEVSPLSWLYCHSQTAPVCHHYLEDIWLPSQDEATFTLGFALDPFFRNATPEQLLPPSDLPRRIWAWLAGPQERVCP